jgi:hypothetical protein
VGDESAYTAVCGKLNAESATIAGPHGGVWVTPELEQSTLHVGEHWVSTPQDRAQVADSAGDRQAGTMREVAYTAE